MKIFTLPNLVSHLVTITDDVIVSSLPNARPGGMSKEQYNQWCRESTTKGAFLSTWEGLNPTGRVAGTNPARFIHGIVADYDHSSALSKIQHLGTTTGHLPTWVVESFSPGKCRLIWAFEEPVLVSNPDVTEAFLKELDAKLKISTALPGFDKASWKDSQYFEHGSNWQQITGSIPVPASLLSECMLSGGLTMKMEISDTEIPMNIVAEEVERRWPGLWGGEFAEGAVGPLFWVEPFINHRSCAVRSNGMVCYSDRAASNFMPWRAILGSKFVEKYETERASKLAEMFFFDGKSYWTNYSNEQVWRALQRSDAELHLKLSKCDPRIKKGSFTSEVDNVIGYIQNNRYVNAAVPLLFNKDQVVHYNGNNLLNICTKKVMQPAETGDPKDFPWIHNYFFNAFDGEQEGIPAYEYMLGWAKRAYVTSLQGNPQQGQSLIIAGEAHAGKSFGAKWIFGAMMGGSCVAEDLLLQRTKFNKEAAHNAIWLCDDAIAKGDSQTKQLIAHSLKAMASNPRVQYQPKFVDAMELPFKGRIILTCNVDPESLKILPYLDGTIKDKLMLFRIAEKFQPHFYNNNAENEARAINELPHFLRFLIDYPVHPGVLDVYNPRFEIKSFHHKHLVEEANSEQPESLLAELIHEAMVVRRGAVKKGEVLRLTASGIARAIEDANYGKSLQQLGGLGNLGKLLHKVIEQELSKHITEKPKQSKGLTSYKFDPWAREDNEELEEITE